MQETLESKNVIRHKLVVFILRTISRLKPQVKSALKLFSDQLDWINKLLEDYMKDNKVATESKASIQEANKRKSWFNGNGNVNDSLKPQVQM